MMKRNFHKLITSKIFKYIVCGGISAAVEFLVFALLHILIANIYVVSFLSFSCGLITSYALNKYVVFNKRGKSGKEVAQFVTLGVINSQVSSFMTLGLSLFLPPLVAKILTIGFIAVWNFVIMNKLIFRKSTT